MKVAFALILAVFVASASAAHCRKHCASMSVGNFVGMIHHYTRSNPTWVVPAGERGSTEFEIHTSSGKIKVKLINTSAPYPQRTARSARMRTAAAAISRCHSLDATTTKGGWIRIGGVEYNLDPI